MVGEIWYTFDLQDFTNGSSLTGGSSCSEAWLAASFCILDAKTLWKTIEQLGISW